MTVAGGSPLDGPRLPHFRPDLVAATKFLQAGADNARTIVAALLEEIADVCDADAEFYSAPGGAGRRAMKVRSSHPQHDGFVLVASTADDAELEQPAPREVVQLLSLAADVRAPPADEGGLEVSSFDGWRRGPAVSIGRRAAAAVVISSGLQGIVLLRARNAEDYLETTAPFNGKSAQANGEEGGEAAAAARAMCLEHAARLLQDEAAAIQAGGFSMMGAVDPTIGIVDPNSAATASRAKDIASKMEAVTSEYVELLEAFPSAVAGGSRAALAGAHVTAMELLPMVRFFSALLAERLERACVQDQLASAKQVLAEVLNALDILRDQQEPVPEYMEMLEAVTRVVPSEVLRGGLSADRVDIWTYDPEAGQVVLNNNGRLDGMRMPVEGSIVGEVALDSSNNILVVKDFGESGLDVSHKRKSVAAFHTKSVVCVPLDLGVAQSNCKGAKEKAAMKQVIEYSSTVGSHENMSAAVRAIDSFEHMAAQAVVHSILPYAMRLRERMLGILYDLHTHQGVKQMADDLADASKASELVAIIERDMPKILRCEKCTLFFINTELGEVWALPSDDKPDGITFDVGEGVAGYASEIALTTSITGEAGSEKCIIMENSPASNPMWSDKMKTVPPGTKNMLLAPIWSPPRHDVLLGLIQLTNKEENATDDDFHGFVAKDKVLVMALLRECAANLQRLMVDIMMTKANMGGSETKKTEGSSIVEAYYGADTSMKKKKQTIVRMGAELKQVGQIFDVIGNRYATVVRSEHWRKVKLCMHHRFFRTDMINIEVGLDDWGVDYWALNDDQQFTLFAQALQRTGAFKDLGVPKRDIFRNYFTAVKSEYNVTPYHNINHAIATVHYSYKFPASVGLFDFITEMGWFSLIVAALTHDAGHRGRNNAFEVITRSDLALRYNDVSVLESHSCARAFEIAAHNVTHNIFSEMSMDQYGNIRKQMVSSIIATDMTYHVEHVKMLQEFQLVNHKSDDDRREQSAALISTFLHAADIANPLMPLDIAQKWGIAVVNEFIEQATEEQRLGIPVASHMQNLDNPIVAAKSALGFMDFVIMPFFGAIFRAFDGFTEVQQNLKEHRDATAVKAETTQRQSRVLGFVKASSSVI